MILTNLRSLHRLVTYILLCIFIGNPCIVKASLPKGGLGFDMGNLPKNGLMPMPTEQEMQEIEKFLSTLSDSEIEELIKYGESITKIAEENNVPLFFEPPANPSTDTPQKSALPTGFDTKKESSESKTKEKNIQVGPTITKDDIAYYKKALEDLLTIIQTIRQRITSVKKIAFSLNDLNKELDSLVYYLHVLQKDTIIYHLKEKKYELLVTLMTTTATQLNQLNNSFDLPSLEALHQHPLSTTTKKQLKLAEKTITSIKKVLDGILHQDNIITTIEGLLKEYEPLALQIKQKNEEKEKAAHEFTKKVPVTNIAKQVTPPSTFTQPYQGPRPNMPMTPPIKPGSPQQAQKAPEAAGSKPTKMMEPVKKQQPAKTKKTTFAELEKDIIDGFDSIEQRLVPSRAHINDFLTTYPTSKNEPELITAALNDANFGLKKIKSLVDDWYKKLEKDSTSKTDMETKAKGLRDVFKNNIRHNNLKTIHTKTKTVAKTGAEGSVKRFKELMDGIEKRIVEIF